MTLGFLSDKYSNLTSYVPSSFGIAIPTLNEPFKQVQKSDCILCYYLTHKYNPDDEIRAKVGDFGEEWGTENK